MVSKSNSIVLVPGLSRAGPWRGGRSLSRAVVCPGLTRAAARCRAGGPAMRLFRNLSVGRKLAASAILAILLLGGLVLLVQRELTGARDQQAAEREAVQARAAAQQGAL